MTTFIVCNIVAMWACLIWMARVITRPQETYAEAHTKLNSNPQLIEADMEASAAYVDKMLAEDRKTAVRTDQAGPNAVVHRPRQIGPKVNGPKYFGR